MGTGRAMVARGAIILIQHGIPDRFRTSVPLEPASVCWNLMSLTGGSGFAAYRQTGQLAEEGEAIKRASWKAAMQYNQQWATEHLEFVPFSIEASGVWGPAATRFFAEAAFYNHYNNRDIDRYHWSSEKFLSLWRTKFSVLMARERGRIGADAALGDIPKRLWAHAFDEMDDGPAR